MKMKLTAMVLAAGAALGLATVAVGASFNLDYMASARAKPAAKEKVSVAANVEEPLDDGVLRQVVIPTSVAPQLDDQLQVGDELDVTLFDDRALTLLLAEQTPSSDGVASFLATTDGYDGEFVAVVVQMDGRIQIDIQDFLSQRVYSVLSSEERTVVREMDPHSLPITDAPAVKVQSQGAVDNLSGEAPTVEHGIPPKVSADNEGTKTVNILVAYDTDAATWVKSNGGGTSAFAETQVQKMNTVIANTGLNSYYRFKLAGVYEIGYSANGNIFDALNAADGTYSTLHGYSWSGVRAKRDEVEADIVCVMVDNGSSYGTTGVGNSLETNSVGFSEYAYNACLIRAVNQGHTMTHEVGHNMGAGHAKEMHPNLDPGPQYKAYSSGYYFTIGSTKYHTIMAYNDDGYGNYYTSVPYFSSPNYTYNSVAVGDADHDNTRTLRETYQEVYKYRGSVESSALGTATETESYTWETSELYPWTMVTSTSNDGVDSARSGSSSPNTWMRTRVVGPATLTFYYKMYTYYGSFEVTCDGSTLFSRKNDTVSGMSWTKVTANIPSGTHVVKFAYTRSGTTWYTTDGVWVDQISFSGGSPATDSYTVTYKPGSYGSGSQQTATKTKDVALTLKGAIFTRSGYTQTGWSTSDGGSKAYNLSASYTANAAITLYPYWTANTYTVTLNMQNGSGGTSSVTATYGSAMPSITVPTRSGYTFGGYFTATGGSGTQYYTASGASARNWDKTSATTLYAKWTSSPTTYTVTYNPGANGSGSQQTATKTKDVALTLKGAIFTRTGYTQTGWSTSDGGSKAYNLSASYTANAVITLYPYWTANTYTVTLDRQNGSGGSSSVTATYGSAMPSITVPTRASYTFGGYFTSTGGGGTQYYTASGTSARNWDRASATTLYAKWTAASSGPANDSFSSPTTISGASGSTSGSNVGATMQTSETKPSARSNSGASVWYKWTAPGSGTATFDTIGSGFDTVLAVYTGTSASSLSEVASDDDSGGSNTSKLTFEAVSGTTYRIAVYGYGSNAGSFNLKWSLVVPTYTVTYKPGSYGSGSQQTATKTKDVALTLKGAIFTRTGYTQTGWSTSDGGSKAYNLGASYTANAAITLYPYWTSSPSGPANDSFSSPTTISGASGSRSGNSSGATMQTSEKKPTAQSNSGASVWFKWTAPSSGTATFDTIGSSFDTVLGVYTGTAVSSIAEVASDDDGGGSGNTSKLTFQAVSGTTYRIAIYGYSGATGNFNLRWSLVASTLANDSFSSPRAISGVSGSISGSSVGATMESSEPRPSAQDYSYASVWFEWTAPDSGMVTFDTDGSSYDTILGVYTGTALASLSEVASDDDGGDNRTSKLIFQANAGTTYRIAIYGYSGESGSFVLRWSQEVAPPAPAPAPCYAVIDEADIKAPYEAKKAVTLKGAVYDGCDVVGIVELKLGKVNTKKGTSKVSGSVIGLDGKKHTIKAVTLTGVTEGCCGMEGAPVSASLEVKDLGTMYVTIGGTLFAGTLGGAYHVQSADVGGAWAGGSAVAAVQAGDLSVFPGRVLGNFLPIDETATVSGGKWKFEKAASVKWAKPKKGAALPEIYDEASGKGLIVDTSKGTNLSGLKLNYTPKKGTFKGSFNVYALEGSGSATKLKKYKLNVSGVVVGGIGYGVATCKKPSIAWTMTVKEK